MDKLKLYFCPLTCARVTLTALEQTRAAFDVQMINVMVGQQFTPEFLALNPKAKVPALQIGDRVLTENAAILTYLDERFPEAGLLPSTTDPVAKAIIRSDVIWCATTLHPLVRQVRAPFHYTDGDTADVRAKAVGIINGVLAKLEARFAAAEWWYGGDWSIVDSYLAWCVSGWGGAIDIAAYPAVAAHAARARAHPAFLAMYDREGALMEEAGIRLPPGMAR